LGVLQGGDEEAADKTEDENVALHASKVLLCRNVR
jgi:hypothetical protein